MQAQTEQKQPSLKEVAFSGKKNPRRFLPKSPKVLRYAEARYDEAVAEYNTFFNCTNIDPVNDDKIADRVSEKMHQARSEFMFSPVFGNDMQIIIKKISVLEEGLVRSNLDGCADCAEHIAWSGAIKADLARLR